MANLSIFIKAEESAQTFTSWVASLVSVMN